MFRFGRSANAVRRLDEDFGAGKTLWESNLTAKPNNSLNIDQVGDPEIELDQERKQRFLQLQEKHLGYCDLKYWPRASPMKIERLFREWMQCDGLQLTHIVEYERPHDGYFVWQFRYFVPERQ